jgi:hypothetical protein
VLRIEPMAWCADQVFCHWNITPNTYFTF